MKPIRIVLVALIALFAFSAVASSSASASPEWYVKKAGKFEKVKGSIEVSGTASWQLVDTGSGFKGIHEPLGISCTYEKAEGTISAGGISDINKLTGQHCTPLKGCEEITHEVEFRGVPLQMELYKEGTEIRSKIVSGSKGLTPEFDFSCKVRVFGTDELDECGMGTSTKMNNLVSGFVEGAFDTKSTKTKCSIGGKETGEWKGTFVTIQPNTGVEAIKVE
jgi:hypothetical protein